MNFESQTIDLVMLVDDNPEANYINSRIIEISEFAQAIVSKTSNTSALEYLDKNKDHLPLLPDLIFLDFNKPALAGFEFLDAIEQRRESIISKCKIVILSNYLNTSEMDTLLKRGQVAGYITKPLLVEKLNALKYSYLKSPNLKQRIN